MPRSAKGGDGNAGSSPQGTSAPIWVATISAVAGILAILIPILLKPQPPTPPGVPEKADVHLKAPVRCQEFPNDQAINRTEFRWLRDLCLRLEKEASGSSHFPAVVLETNVIPESSPLSGELECGVYTAIDGYAFLADTKKEAFTPLSSHVERNASECTFKFATPKITAPQSILLVLVISGEPGALTQAGIRNLALEVNP